MSDPAPLLMPAPIVIELTDAMAGTERALARSEVVCARAESAITRLEVHLKRLETQDEERSVVRARADADRLEGRSRLEVILTSPRMLLLYGAAISAVLTYLLGSLGIAPAVVTEALQHAQDVPHASTPVVAAPSAPASEGARE